MSKLDTSTHGHLKRVLRPSWVFAMAVGSAVGWGAFILPFDWLTTGGFLGSAVGFIVGGGMIAIIGLSYGTVIRALPVTGGGLAFALAGAGRVHGFIAGWSLTLGYAGIVALNASAVTLVFRVTVPELVMWGKLYSVADWDVYAPEVFIATLFLVLFAYLNVRGVEFSGRFQFIAVALMLAGVVLLCVAAIVYWALKTPALPEAFVTTAPAISGIVAVIAITPWAYIGFDTIPQLAGEFNFSPRKALSLLIWGILAATGIYLAMITVTAIAVGSQSEEMKNAAWPTGEAIASIFGPVGLLLLVIAVSMGVLTGLNGFYAASSRVIFTMGRAGMLPTSFGRLHPNYGTPVTGLLVTTLLCLVTPWFGRAALSWVVDMTSVGITIAYFYTCYCAYKIGKEGHVFGMAAKLQPKRYQQLVGILGCILALTFMALLLVPGSPGALGSESLLALAIWCVTGVVFYLSRRKSLHSTSSSHLMKTVFR